MRGLYGNAEPIDDLLARAYRPVEDLAPLLRAAGNDERVLRCALERLAARQPNARISATASVHYFLGELRREIMAVNVQLARNASRGCTLAEMFPRGPISGLVAGLIVQAP